MELEKTGLSFDYKNGWRECTFWILIQFEEEA